MAWDTIDMRYLTWDTKIEIRYLTWDTIDIRYLTWDTIDIRYLIRMLPPAVPVSVLDIHHVLDCGDTELLKVWFGQITALIVLSPVTTHPG